MTEFADPPVRFYLEHEEIIDTWAALADRTHESLSQWLLSLEVETADIARDLGAVAVLSEDGRWKSHRLCRSTWNEDPTAGEPFAVALEWDSKKIKLPPVPPVVGLLVSGSGEVNDTRREFLSRFSDRIEGFGRYKRGNANTWWPARRDLPPEPEASRWWEHLDDYREQLLAAFTQAWTDLAPLVDEWVEA